MDDVLVAAPSAPIAGDHHRPGATCSAVQRVRCSGRRRRRHPGGGIPAATRPASAPRSPGSVTSGAVHFGGAQLHRQRSARRSCRAARVRARDGHRRRRRSRTRASCTCSTAPTGRIAQGRPSRRRERPVFGSAGSGRRSRRWPGNLRAPGSAGIGPCYSRRLRVGDRRRRRRRPAGLRGRRAGLHGAGRELRRRVPRVSGRRRHLPRRRTRLRRARRADHRLVADPARRLVRRQREPRAVPGPGRQRRSAPVRVGAHRVGDLGQLRRRRSRAERPASAVPVPLTNVPDGKPDFVASAPGADSGATPDAGAAFVVDRPVSPRCCVIDSPSPQGGAAFGSFTQSFAAPGQARRRRAPDIVVGAPGMTARAPRIS